MLASHTKFMTVPADAMKRLGVADLNAMNNGEGINSLAKFATGGYVGSAAITPAAGRSGDVTIAPTITMEGGSDPSANASNASALNKKITAAIKTIVANERKQGGVLWKARNGIA